MGQVDTGPHLHALRGQQNTDLYPVDKEYHWPLGVP